MSADGYILTNKHVISGASKINVVLDDGTTYEGVKLVATDPLNDIAFLKIRISVPVDRIDREVECERTVTV